MSQETYRHELKYLISIPAVSYTHLDVYKRQAWLALRTRTDEAFTVEGGKGYPINDHFAWIHAVSDQVRISWEVKK